MIAGLLLALAAQEAAAQDIASQDIVVRAVGRRKCAVEYADRTMSDAELRRRADQWAAGTPVRVVARRDADFKCLKTIAFKLVRRGVNRIEFVAPQDLPRD